jgi:hypothetical protein
VISNSYGEVNEAGLFIIRTPRSDTTDMLRVEYVDRVAKMLSRVPGGKLVVRSQDGRCNATIP